MRLVFLSIICISEGQFFIGPYDISKIQPEGDVELRNVSNSERKIKLMCTLIARTIVYSTRNHELTEQYVIETIKGLIRVE